MSKVPCVICKKIIEVPDKFIIDGLIEDRENGYDPVPFICLWCEVKEQENEDE